MSRTSETAHLLAEITRWQEQGIIDDTVADRLRSLYPPASVPQRAALYDAAPDSEAPQRAGLPDAAPTSETVEVKEKTPLAEFLDQCLERELEARARIELAAAPPQPAAPELESQLEIDVAFVQQIAAAGRARRKTEKAEPQQQNAEATSPEETIAARDSSIWRPLRRFVTDNALWFVGAALLLFGSIYFLRLLWDISSVWWFFAFSATLYAYGGAFFGVGYLAAKKRQAHTLARTLFYFSMGILPLADIALGQLLAQAASHAVGIAPKLLALLAAGLALSARHGMVQVMAGLFERRMRRSLSWLCLGFALLTASVAPLLALGWLPTHFSAGFSLLLLAFGLRSLWRGGANLAISVAFYLASCLWALLVLFGRLHFATPLALGTVALILAATLTLLLETDQRLRSRSGSRARLSALAIALLALQWFALGLGVCGLFDVGFYSLGARLSLFFVAALLTFSALRSALRLERRLLAGFAAFFGLLVYYLAPALFSGLLQQLGAFAQKALGYGDKPLPLAFYGATLMPYGLLLVASFLLLRKRSIKVATTLLQASWPLIALCSMLAATNLQDLRALLIALPLSAALALLLGRLVHNPWASMVGQLLSSVFFLTLGLHWCEHGQAPWASALLALQASALAAYALFQRRKLRQTELISALAALTLSFCLLPLGSGYPAGIPFAEPPLATLIHATTLTLALILLAKVLRLWVSAYLAALCAFGTLLIGIAHFQLSPDIQTSFLAAGLALPTFAIAAWIDRRGLDEHRLIAGPLQLFALVCLPLAALAGKSHLGSGLLAGVALMALLGARARALAPIAAVLTTTLALHAIAGLPSGVRYAVAGLLPLLFWLRDRVWLERLGPCPCRHSLVLSAALSATAVLSSGYLTLADGESTLLVAAQLFGAVGLFAAYRAHRGASIGGAKLAAVALSAVVLILPTLWDASATQVVVVAGAAALLLLGLSSRIDLQPTGTKLALMPATAATLLGALLLLIGYSHGPLRGSTIPLATPAALLIGAALAAVALIKRARWADSPQRFHATLAPPVTLFAGSLLMVLALSELAAAIGLFVTLPMLAAVGALWIAWPALERHDCDLRLLGGLRALALILGASALLHAVLFYQLSSTPLWALATGPLTFGLALYRFGPRTIYGLASSLALRVAFGAGLAVAVLAALGAHEQLPIGQWSKASLMTVGLALFSAIVGLAWRREAQACLKKTLGLFGLYLAFAPIGVLLSYLALRCGDSTVLDGQIELLLLSLAGLTLAAAAWLHRSRRALALALLPLGASMLFALGGEHLYLLPSGLLLLAALTHWLAMADARSRTFPAWLQSAPKTGELIVLALLALASSHLHVAALSIASTALLVALLASLGHTPSIERFEALSWVAILATSFGATALAPDGARLTSRTLVALGAAALLSVTALRWLRSRLFSDRPPLLARGARLLDLFTLLGIGIAALGALFAAGISEAFWPQALAALTLGLFAALSLYRAKVGGSVSDARWAMLALASLYVALRLFGMRSASWLWPDVLLGAMLFGAAAALAKRLPAGSRAKAAFEQPLRELACCGPALIGLPLLVALQGDDRGWVGLALGVFAIHYLASAQLLGARTLNTVGMVLVNLALLIAGPHRGLTGPLLLFVPSGVSALLLIRLYREQLDPKTRSFLRGFSMLWLYGGSIVSTLGGSSVLWALVLIPSLCVAAVVAGVALKVRAYVVYGIGSLLLHMGAHMLRYGLASPILGAAFLSGLGLLLVGGMVAFTLERERILTRYSHLLADWRAWE